VPRKQDAGGQSALRFQRNREIALNEWFKHCNDMLSEIYNKYNCKILLGIHKCNEFNFNKHMSYNIKSNILHSDSVSYINYNGIEQLLDKCSNEIAAYHISNDRKLVDEISKMIMKSDNKISYGINCLKEVSQSNIEKVVYSSTVDSTIEQEILKLNCEKIKLHNYPLIDSFKIIVIKFF